MNDAISPILLDQRIRNRIIEYLEIASSYDEQLQYEANVPIAHVPAEMIEMWADWLHPKEEYAEPVYSPEEKAAILKFHAIWNAVRDETPKNMPPLKDLLGSAPWEELRLGAEDALKVFRLRGKFDEEHAQFL